MPRFNAKEADPVRYEKVKASQASLLESCAGQPQMARICPYCSHKAELLYRGDHGPCRLKCANCGEEVIFPAVSFRRSRPMTA